MLIVSVDHFIYINGQYFCKPYSFLSLSQYWDNFNRIKLLGHQIIGSSIPEGWIAIPKEISFYPINGINNFNLIERKKTKNKIWDFIKDEKIAYIRMPDFRVLEIYKLIKNKIPYFCEFHGDWEESLLAQKLNKEGFKNRIKGYLSKYRAKKAGEFYREIGRGAVANISIGPKLIEKYNLDIKPSLATANHIMKEDMIKGRESFDLKDNILRLLFVGELQHRKGLYYLIHALAKLKNEYSDNFTLSIVGVGYLDSELKQMVKDLGLSKNISFKGAIYDRNILGKEYEDSNVFILPSIAGEGVPRVLQEAQAYGCAIIATDIGSTYWQLQNNSGILIKPNNIKDIVDAIKIMFNSEDRKEYSQNASTNALSFTYEKQKYGIKQFLETNLNKYLDE
jgi:glycosyltransferase involved in cell wall biosynthesis